MRNSYGFPYVVVMYEPRRKSKFPFLFILAVIIFTLIVTACVWPAEAGENLKASWYSIASLKKEGTYRYSKAIMANGQLFNDLAPTCATRLYPLNTWLRIININNNQSVLVKVTDRIGKRFAEKRIDLSRGAFSQIAELKQGVIPISVEVIK